MIINFSKINGSIYRHKIEPLGGQICSPGGKLLDGDMMTKATRASGSSREGDSNTWVIGELCYRIKI